MMSGNPECTVAYIISDFIELQVHPRDIWLIKNKNVAFNCVIARLAQGRPKNSGVIIYSNANRRATNSTLLIWFLRIVQFINQ